jgi:acyl dehydratase
MTETTPFDPLSHRLAEPAAFEDMVVGSRWPIPSRTMTDALFAAFQLASGDNHPIHYDVEYCKAKGHPAMLAHGMQVLIQSAAGAGQLAAAMEDALIAFLETTGKFLKPVYAGDTLYPMLEVVEVKPQNTTGVVTVRSTVHNQKGELVFEGSQKYLMRKKTAAKA